MLALANLFSVSTRHNKIKQDSVPCMNKPGANPLLQKWDGPYNGVPPLDLVTAEHFKPALEVLAVRDQISLRFDGPTANNM